MEMFICLKVTFKWRMLILGYELNKFSTSSTNLMSKLTFNGDLSKPRKKNWTKRTDFTYSWTKKNLKKE
jgi:hypothetical protein